MKKEKFAKIARYIQINKGRVGAKTAAVFLGEIAKTAQTTPDSDPINIDWNFNSFSLDTEENFFGMPLDQSLADLLFDSRDETKEPRMKTLQLKKVKRGHVQGFCTALTNHGVSPQLRMTLCESLLANRNRENANTHYQLARLTAQTFEAHDLLQQNAHSFVDAFEQPENIIAMNEAWRKKFGSGSYQKMKEKLLMGKATEKQKMRFIRFDADHFADFIGVDAKLKQKFFDEEAKGGFITRGVKIGKRTIKLNRRTPEFRNDIVSTISTNRHEIMHVKQGEQARKYNSGKTQDMSPEEKELARIYSLSRKTCIQGEENFILYKEQPIEDEAGHDGKGIAGYTQQYFRRYISEIIVPKLAKDRYHWLKKGILVAGLALSSFSLNNKKDKAAPAANPVNTVQITPPSAKPVAVKPAPKSHKAAHVADTTVQELPVSTPQAIQSETSDTATVSVAAQFPEIKPVEALPQAVDTLSDYAKNQQDIAWKILGSNKMMKKLERINDLIENGHDVRASKKIARFERKTGADATTVANLLQLTMKN